MEETEVKNKWSRREMGRELECVMTPVVEGRCPGGGEKDKDGQRTSLN
jgi:hypothetical protein